MLDPIQKLPVRPGSSSERVELFTSDSSSSELEEVQSDDDDYSISLRLLISEW